MDSKEAVKSQVICHVCSVGRHHGDTTVRYVCMSAVVGVPLLVSPDHPTRTGMDCQDCQERRTASASIVGVGLDVDVGIGDTMTLGTSSV